MWGISERAKQAQGPESAVRMIALGITCLAVTAALYIVTGVPWWIIAFLGLALLGNGIRAVVTRPWENPPTVPDVPSYGPDYGQLPRS